MYFSSPLLAFEAPFFPMIFGKMSNCKQFISEIILFNDPKEIYIQGRDKNSILDQNNLPAKVIVVSIECA